MNNTVKFFHDAVMGSAVDPGNPKMMEMFGDRKFKFGVFLVNADGKLFKISRPAIDELYIVDDMMDWFHHGHIIFSNPKDIIERSTKLFTNQGKEVEVTPYRFRNDARDFLYVTMDPYLEDGETQNVSEQMESYVHSLRFLFSIYAMEDILTPSGPNDKKQKLYFRDYRLQALLEKNTYYSTAKTPYKLGENTNVGSNTKQKNNTDRGKMTGEIIQDILISSLQETDTKSLFSKHWEFGDQPMFYTSSCNNKAFDDLQYVLDRHVSSEEYNHEPCLLKLERYTDRWELLPLSKIFERSHNGTSPGAYQSERFLLALDLDTITGQTIPPPAKTFGPNGHTLINYTYPDLSIITDYTFSEMNGSDCQSLLNSGIVHRYDEANKTFSIDLVESNIKHIHDMFQDRYITHMKGGDSGEGYAAWLSDKTREENYNVQVVDSWTPNKQLSLQARNKKILSAMMLGNGIQFEAKGATSRRSGVWMSLDVDMSYDDTDYEKKVLGQYFIVRTEHKITSTDYTNNIIGVKPYYYENPNFTDGDFFYKDPEKIFESK